MNMPFVLVSFIWFLVPGLMVYRLVPGSLKNPVFVPVVSWIYLAVIFAVARMLTVPTAALPYILYGGMAILTLWSLHGAAGGFAAFESNLAKKWYVVFAAMFIFVGYSIYHLWAGVYLEIPADIYSHLDKLHSEYDRVGKTGYLREASFGGIGDILERHWYVIYAYLIHHTGNSVETVFPGIVYVNSIILLLSVYYVGLHLFARIKVDTSVKILASLASVMFFVLHFGVNVFAYVRYYSLAPTVTAYVVFLGSVVVSDQFFSEKLSWKKYCTAFGLMTIIAGTIHMQEAIFSVMTAWAIAVVFFLQNYINNYNIAKRSGDLLNNRLLPLIRSRAGLIAISGIIVGLAAVIVSFAMIERNEPERPWIEPVATYLPFIKNLFILNPRYQFFHVLAVWGYLVYVLFLFKLKKFSRSPFILAGMIVIPLATVLNPVFVDLYLRHENPYTLYRVMYAIPLFFVGGYLFVLFFRYTFIADNLVKRGGAGLIVILLLVVLLPFDVMYAENRYSRIHTLKQTYRDDTPNHWQDLIEALNRIDARDIITDPVTGYVVNGLTKHRVRTGKYHKVWVELDDQAYEDDRDMFADYDGYFLVVNLRGGGLSSTGRLSRHWPSNVLETQQYYSEGLIRFVENEKSMFLPVWEQDSISVYRVRYHE